jgi:glycosidase
LWWIEYAGLSGLRVDTYPYADRAFLSVWSRRVMQEYPRLNVVAEEWRSSPITVSYWQRGRTHADGYVSELPSLFDFPLQETTAIALQEKETSSTGLVRIYRMLASDGVYADPYNLVVFPDNHDMSRILTQLGERVDLQRMAVAFFLTTRGIPQVYYGTEVLMSNPGIKADGMIRSDFPGGWPGDATNAFTGQGLSVAARESQEFMRKLLNWRRTAPAMRDGKLTQYVPQDGVYVYFRHNDAQRVMVVLNNSDESRTLDMHRFEESTGGATSAVNVITQQGRALQSLAVPARSATVFELQ